MKSPKKKCGQIAQKFQAKFQLSADHFFFVNTKSTTSPQPTDRENEKIEIHSVGKIQIFSQFNAKRV